MRSLSPTNWEYIKLSALRGSKRNGFDPRLYPDEPFELYSVPSFEGRQPEILSGGEIGSAKQRVTPGQVLLCKINPRINRVWVVGDRTPSPKIASTEWVVLDPGAMFEPRFLQLYLTQSSVRDYLAMNVSGVGGSLMRARTEAIDRISVPVPPLYEQRRIVEAIETQLTRLDAAVAALKRAQANLKRYRASVLKAAVEGRLVPTEAELARQEARPTRLINDGSATEAALMQRWTSLTGLEVPDSWILTTLGELAVRITSGSRGWAQYYSESGPIFIRAQDIKTDALVLDEAAHVTLPAGAEGTRTRVRDGDILVTITGANVTKSALVTIAPDESYVSQHVGLVSLAEPQLSRWVHIWLIAPLHGRRLLELAAYGAGKPGLNLENLRELLVPLPPFSAQEHLLSELRELLSATDVQERFVSDSLSRSNRLRQSILAQAFAGQLELVP